MRFLILYASCFLLGSLIACDEDGNALLNDLPGTWEAYHGSVTQCDDFNNNRPGINYIPCPDSPCLVLVFNEVGEINFNTHPSTGSYKEVEGDYTVSKAELTVCLDFVIECFIYDVEISGDQMTLTQISETTGCVAVTDYVKKI